MSHTPTPASRKELGARLNAALDGTADELQGGRLTAAEPHIEEKEVALSRAFTASMKVVEAVRLVSDLNTAQARIAHLELVNWVQATTVNAMEAQLAEVLPWARIGALTCSGSRDRASRALAIRGRIDAGEFGPLTAG